MRVYFMMSSGCLQNHMPGQMSTVVAEGLTHRNVSWIHAQLYLDMSCSVCTVVSQTSPSYTVSFTRESAIHSSSSGAIYVNDAPANCALCDGTVYAWYYCYYPINNENNVRVALGVYEYNSANDQFILRPGS